VFSGDDGNGGNTEGGETTEPDDTKPDEPEPELPDPYYGFRIFDTSDLDSSKGEAYLVGYNEDTDLNYMDFLCAMEYAAASVDGFAYIILLKNQPENEETGQQYTIRKNIILDLNGHTLSNTGNTNDEIIIDDGGHLKLIDTSESKNGAIIASRADGNTRIPSAISMNEGASLTVYDGNISGAAAAIYAEGSATITIKRGRFENVGSSAPIIVTAKSKITIDGGTFIAGTTPKPMIVFGTNGKGSTIIVNDCDYNGDIVDTNLLEKREVELIDNRENK
jgi:hypothetical protein